jgi:hypothetical protein
VWCDLQSREDGLYPLRSASSTRPRTIEPTAPKRSVKILDVTFDLGLSMKEHVSKAVAKAISKCMTLQMIRGVRPAPMRQM